MSYGLYDGDLKLYPRVPFFNLELMKLSTYYKRKREIVNFSPEFAPHMYTHFIVRQDYPSRTPYSTTYSNIEYGGRAFDGEKYEPLTDEIEFLRPNTDLYNKIESKIPQTSATKSQFNVMRRAEHIRLSLDGKTIHPNWYKQLRQDNDCYGLIFHDYNLGAIDGAYDFIKNNLNNLISNTLGRRIGMKFPTQLDNEDDLCKWLALPPLKSYFFLQYNGILTTNHIAEFKELRQGSSSQIQTSINITRNIDYETFITTGIVQLFKTILDLRRERIIFPLIYDTDFFMDKRWEEVVKLIVNYNIWNKKRIYNEDFFNRVVPYNTLYDYMKNMTYEDPYYGSQYPKEKARELFQFVREQNYELFVLFYEYTGEKLL